MCVLGYPESLAGEEFMDDAAVAEIGEVALPEEASGEDIVMMKL